MQTLKPVSLHGSSNGFDANIVNGFGSGPIAQNLVIIKRILPQVCHGFVINWIDETYIWIICDRLYILCQSLPSFRMQGHLWAAQQKCATSMLPVRLRLRVWSRYHRKQPPC